MIAALTGALLTVVTGFVVMLCTDREVREATATVLWGIAAGPVLLFLALVVALSRATGGWRIPLLKGKRLSTAALRRFTDRIDTGGWVITWRGGGFLLIRKARAK